MQGNKLYVGNMNYSTTHQELEELFTKHGKVESIKLIEGKGFGFVEMSTQSEAEAAKQQLDGFEFKGRKLKVNEAKPMGTRPKRDFKRRY